MGDTKCNKDGWVKKKLGEVLQVERGGSPRPISSFLTDSEDGINWIKISDAVDGNKYISQTKEKIKPEGMKKSRFVHKGDFILSNSMSFGKPYILQIDGCIHDGWLVLHDEKNAFDKIWLYYYLGSPFVYREFQRMAEGGVVNNLNSSLVRNLKIVIPPLSEQQHIVSELDCLNGIIEKQKEQLKQLDELAQSIFYDMFGDPVENEMGWEFFKLSNICDKITDGTHNSPKTYTQGDYLYVTAKNIKPDGFDFSDISYVSRDVHIPIYARCNPELGDVLYIKDGATTGIAMINNLTEEFSLLSSVALLKVKRDQLVNYYLKYLLNNSSKYAEIREMMGGAAITRLTITKIKDIKIPVPPLALQQAFASKIEAIEHQKELIKKSIAETETLFNSRMDYYFG